MTVKRILSGKGNEVLTIEPTAPLAAATKLMSERRFGALVVTGADHRIVGIISERDIVRALVRSEPILGEAIGAIMTRDVIVGTSQDDLVAVGTTMTEHRIRHLPIVEGGRLLGIVSLGDVVKAQRDQYQGEVDTLQFQILNEEDVKAPRVS